MAKVKDTPHTCPTKFKLILYYLKKDSFTRKRALCYEHYLVAK